MARRSRSGRDAERADLPASTQLSRQMGGYLKVRTYPELRATEERPLQGLPTRQMQWRVALALSAPKPQRRPVPPTCLVTSSMSARACPTCVPVTPRRATRLTRTRLETGREAQGAASASPASRSRLRLHPATRPADRHRRTDLQPPNLAALPAPDPLRQTAVAVVGGDHRGQIQLRPSVAARAVGGKRMPIRSLPKLCQTSTVSEHNRHRAD